MILGMDTLRLGTWNLRALTVWTRALTNLQKEHSTKRERRQGPAKIRVGKSQFTVQHRPWCLYQARYDQTRGLSLVALGLCETGCWLHLIQNRPIQFHAGIWKSRRRVLFGYLWKCIAGRSTLQINRTTTARRMWVVGPPNPTG